MPNFELPRPLPDGRIKKRKVVSRTLRAVCVAAAHCLHDNHAAGQADVQRFSKTLAAAPLGEFLPHPSGYSFKVDHVAARKVAGQR
ncbi:hypothetical protein [Actinomadura hibisca]|uniref:hypothetical protein n=1 Tax=Actinomadura hibisca TaxID=68565 RepID=UPI0008335AF3|nr:hypothetical protein [Actinomadura hibisca]